MHNLKRLLALFLALMMLLSFVACSVQEDDDDDDDDKKENTTDVATDGATEAPTNNDSIDPIVPSIEAVAESYIEEGNYLAAYELLRDLPYPNQRQKDLLASLRFLPTEVIRDGTKIVYTYDEKGNLLTEETFDISYENNAYLEHTVTYTYDDSSNLLTKESAYTDGGSTIYTYTYDSKGNCLSEKKSPDSRGYWSEITSTYNEEGYWLTREGTYYIDGNQQTEKVTYTYDDNGNLLTYHYEEIGYYNGTYYSGKNPYTITFTYNEKGDLLTEETTGFGFSYKETYYYDAYGHLLSSKRDSMRDGAVSYHSETIYTTDEKGNKLTADCTYSNGDWDKATWTYDKDGNMLSYEYSDSESTHKTIWTYDNWGNRLSETGTGTDGETSSYKLFYNPKFATEVEQYIFK